MTNSEKTDLQNRAASHNAAQFYATRLGSYDEMLSHQNEVQPHWQHFMEAIEHMGGQELDGRRKESQRLLRENGVTYNVYSDSGHFTRPWKLDPIPLLISAAEWQSIEQGLKQRAELLNLIFRDLYGRQNLLKKGRLPAELIYAHQGFLAPCLGTLTDFSRLTIYAANLARGPNGNMWVLNDHTQAPSGIGYSLENRSVIGRVMADLFQDAQVQRLGSFFSALQKGLAQSAPHNKSEPHIVVLTPGPLNETYFEHAFLAAQLGFTLAQGEDLTVRDGKLWLRTLEGLQPVDVLLRRVDDTFCDPLELRGSSQLGVAGLLQAVRQGNVSIANPLGSSILENPGLLAFLPGLCRYFLNQDLRLPSVATWWCGQAKERDFVIKNIDRLAIKPINRGGTNHVIFGNSLSREQRSELIDKIKAKPYLYIGQEQITFSTVPTLINRNIEARNSILRGFAVSSDDSYQIMPGGLTRVAANKDQYTVSNQFGAINKDTWVLTEEAVEEHHPPQPSQNIAIPAITEPLSSRAADNFFWVGRNFERILGVTRLLRTILVKQTNLMNGYDSDSQQCLQVLLRALTHLTVTYPGFVEMAQMSPAQQHQEILSLFRDQQRHGTLASNIQSFFQAAFNIRDLWSQDTWRCIDSMQHYWYSQVVTMEHPNPQLIRYLTELSTRLAAFNGLAAESMTRESGWLLLQLGQKLERSLSLVSLLRSTIVPKQPDTQLYLVLEALLEITDSFSIYKRRYRSGTRLPMLLELLLADESLPYSLLFQLKNLHEYVSKLPRHSNKNRLRREERLVLKAYTDLQLCDIDALLADNDDGVYDNLDTLLSDIAQSLWNAADAIAQTYFNHISATHQLSPTWAEDNL